MMLWCHQSPIDLVEVDFPAVQLNYQEGVTQVVNGEYCVELLFGTDYGMEFESHTFRAVVAVLFEPGLLSLPRFSYDAALQRRRELVGDARNVDA